MKTLQDYRDDYNRTVNELIRKANDGGKGYVMKEDLFISVQWQKDNNFLPSDPESWKKVQALKEVDKEFFEIVLKGIEILLFTN